MGHEFKLIIAGPLGRPETSKAQPGRTLQYYSAAAEIDLCKPGYETHIYKLLNEAQKALAKDKKGVWPYVEYSKDAEGEEDVPVCGDLYGAPLAPVSVRDALKALSLDEIHSAEAEGNWPYWRFRVAVDLLRSCQAALDAGQTRDKLVVLAWGH